MLKSIVYDIIKKEGIEEGIEKGIENAKMEDILSVHPRYLGINSEASLVVELHF
ncbi:MAG: hypothetical protein ACE5KT_12735 [Methanosarcinales archaeon]